MELMKRSLSSIFCTKSDDSVEESLFFIKNGSKLLEELITQLGGRSKNPLRNYSSIELAQAIRGLVTEDSHYRIYKGSFEKNQILIKKYVSHNRWAQQVESHAVRDIVISSQMNFHKNVLKLIGYCLDYEYPALVYQSPETCECLDHYMLNTKVTWESKLSLALDIAYVLVYLHTAFQTPVIHRNMKLGHFVIDKHGTAKFADFSFCISIPLGKSQVEDVVMGTNGYVDPAYAATGILTEKTDVYNFGLVFIELLTRRRVSYLECNENFDHSIDYLRSNIMVMEGEMGKDEEVRDIAELALCCIRSDRESRPDMVDVANELRRMLRSACSSSTS